jgi:hypothetical protein
MFSVSLCEGFGGADENNNVLGEDDRLPRKRQTFFIFTITMVISQTAISYKSLLLGILLMCLAILSAHAKSDGRQSFLVYADRSWDANFQDSKPDKEKKTADPETKKSDTKRIDPDKQDPKKAEIKEVPKARKQLKPAAVKPKVKQVKIIRPKIKKH